MERQWCLYVRQKIRDAKRYLKTDYRSSTRWLHLCWPQLKVCAKWSRRARLSTTVFALDMRRARNPDSSRMFERKDWLTTTKVQWCFFETSGRKKTGKPGSWEGGSLRRRREAGKTWNVGNVAGQLSLKQPICYVLYCLFDLSRDKKLPWNFQRSLA